MIIPKNFAMLFMKWAFSKEDRSFDVKPRCFNNQHYMGSEKPYCLIFSRYYCRLLSKSDFNSLYKWCVLFNRREHKVFYGFI